MIRLQGHIERIQYRHGTSHYTICKLRLANSRRMVTVVGYMAGVQPGDALWLEGRWETHEKYGEQFKIVSFQILPADPLESVRKFLHSGFIKGIGPKMARRLLAHFDTSLLEVMDTAPERLSEVSGIGSAKASEIASAWQAHHGTRRAMLFLQSHGLKPFHCSKVLAVLGPDAVDIIREDPYRIYTDIDEIDFFLADSLAQRMGIARDDLRRIQACLLYLLDKAMAQGNTFVNKHDLMMSCAGITQGEKDEIDAALGTLAASQMVAIEDHGDTDGMAPVYLKPLQMAESGIADAIMKRESVASMLPRTGSDGELPLDQIASEVVRKLAIQPSGDQLSVLENVMVHRNVIITGGPGTGKTTLIRSICAVFEALGRRICLMAPTGRAARRLSEVTHRKASTIHKLLGFHMEEGRFEKNRDNPLEADAVIVDEASMVDVMLMYHLIQAVPVQAVLVLVGDVFQLPPVGPGNVLSDLIASQRVPTFELKEVFRQAQESPIVVNAHRVRSGRMPDLAASDLADPGKEFYFLHQKTPEGVVRTIEKLCTQLIPDHFGLDPVRDIQVLSPMHKGEAGIIQLNQVLQTTLNRNPSATHRAYRGFRVGDKVMHLKNNYQKDVFNGDIGFISAMDVDDQEFLVNFDGRDIPYAFDEVDELSLAYAISVHKSQGSEYPAVIVPLITRHYVMLQRNLLYTAMTRGCRLVVLVGMPRAVEIALHNDKPTQRLTSLSQRLSTYA